jgi:hypothetical protein
MLLISFESNKNFQPPEIISGGFLIPGRSSLTDLGIFALFISMTNWHQSILKD